MGLELLRVKWQRKTLDQFEKLKHLLINSNNYSTTATACN